MLASINYVKVVLVTLTAVLVPPRLYSIMLTSSHAHLRNLPLLPPHLPCKPVNCKLERAHRSLYRKDDLTQPGQKENTKPKKNMIFIGYCSPRTTYVRSNVTMAVLSLVKFQVKV